MPCRDDSPVLQDLRESQIPTVLLDRVAKGTEFDHVVADNAAAAREGTRHLVGLGHRRILLLASDPTLRNIQERVEGYREALQEAGLTATENVLVTGRNEVDPARQALAVVLAGSRRPSAVFALTQTMTIGALQAVAEVGLDLPQEVSLLAFDDCAWFTALRPYISTLSQPTDDFADQAWVMLMAGLNEDRSPTQRSQVSCRLVVRDSTAPYRAPRAREAVPAPATPRA